MAAGDRTKKIFGKVQYALAGVDNRSLGALAQKLPDALILDTMADYDTRLAEETLCIETSASLSIVSGAVAEPSGFYKANLIVLPSTLTCQLREIDVEQFDLLSIRASGAMTGQSPLYFKRWAGTLTFYPTPANGSYTMYYWGTPTTTPTSAVDPVCPSIFDRAIEYGVIGDLAPLVGKNDIVNLYLSRYEQERARLINSYRRTKTNTYSIVPWE